VTPSGDLGGDAVEHAVQTELEPFIPGLLGVRIDIGAQHAEEVAEPSGLG
jgi:hypothetical protein